ncbi:MAG: TetR/AcrR family transcriptional regulator [Lachnospiraceae bacterium]|nr:TetR/AcrR family transcriptional regulator [Lachnospiraceae bacterium]
MKSEKTKEKIIQQTILLIEECDGNIADITIRKIAERAKVGIGLINHYFISKDYLIEICVQSIIKNVVHSFKIANCAGKNPREITQYVAKQVMDFLMENKEISRISILGDLNLPKEEDNSFHTAFGFAYCMSGGINPEKKMKSAFFLVALLQGSFLRKDVLNKKIDIDFYDKNQRDKYIGDIVSMIMEGNINE